jgi:uncharacterized protein with PCYCGC motif
MSNAVRIAWVILLAIATSPVALVATQQKPQESGTRPRKRGATSPASQQAIPPYHKSAKQAKPFPALIPASHFHNYPVVARAYQIANDIPGVMAQQPCYCNCDKFFGHSSLLDCFASDHTAGCAICVKEAFFTEQLTKQGKRPAEIRQAIIRGDWRNVTLNPPSR